MKKIVFIIFGTLLLTNQIQAQFTLTDSLKAYYPFNNNAIDESGNGNNGTVNGATITIDRFGNAISAYSFDGVDDWISLPTPSQLLNTSTSLFTFSAWINSAAGDGTTSQNVFEATTATSGTNNEVYFEASMPGTMRFGMTDDSNGEHLATSRSLDLNTWYHIAGTYDGAEQKIYINGVLDDTQAWVDSYTINSGIFIGKDIEGGQLFNGKLDDLRIYNRSLSESEVLQLYANYYPPDTLIAEPGDKQVTLSWDTTNWENLDKVYIYRDLTLHDSVNITSINDTSYTDLNLINYQAYSYFIQSKDDWGNMSISSDTITSFPCEIVTDWDGNSYKTTKIGNQVWMAENLKSINYADGTPLVDGTGIGDISGDYTTKYYFYYNNDSATYADTYGALYTWAAVMNGAASSNNNPSGVQGVCPDGWHVPSDTAWKELEMYLGMSQVEADKTVGWRGTDEGGKLKEIGTIHWDLFNTGATNESGFTALPGGYRGHNEVFSLIRSDGYWWSSAENDATHAWFRRLNYDNSGVDRYDDNKSLGFSVRCVKTHTLYTDSLALVALYDSTNGANWTNNTNWLTGPVSTWFGITVSDNRVTEIGFDQNNLSGTIPPEIGNLTNLTLFSLEENQLTGSIPTEIGNLTNLTTLRFYNSQLSDSIPSEIGNLTNLTFLDFNNNQLTGPIPAEIGNLINLDFLDLSNNQLSGSIPTEIGNLANLTLLQLSGNQLTGSIPTEIGNLTNLTQIQLPYNQLSGPIPNGIVNLTNLQLLSIYNNEFTDLPDLSSLTSLAELGIQNNKFSFKDIEPNIGVASITYTYSPQDNVGEIIDTTVYIGTSYTMSVSTGGASSQYQWKKDGTNIGSISIDSTYTLNPVAFSDSGTYTCEITNTVATDLTLYSRPVNVYVDYSPLQKDSLALVALYDSTNGANWTNNTNWLTGPVSTWYGITVSGDRVTRIILNSNNLTGLLPPAIGDLSNLEVLTCEWNQISGSIPVELWNLTNLRTLKLSDNLLVGTFPPEIANLINLQSFFIYDNNLSGGIPEEILNLTQLTGLWIWGNEFTDLPNLSSLTTLSELYIQDNKLNFEDIEPNIGAASTAFTYSPQDSVGEIIDTTVYIGTSYTMSVSTGGASSQYQWKKDGTNIGTVSGDSTYTINPVSLSDSGAYTCEITNTVVTDLTLYSRPVNVSVPSVLNSENDILSFSFAEQTGATIIDAVNHTVDIEVVYGTNLANMVATFSISSQASIAINSVDQISGVTANDFTNPVTYTVTAENGTPQDWIVTVSEAGIPVISHFPYSEDFESGNGSWRTGGANSSWQLGNPTGSTINFANSGSIAWVTNLAGDYYQNEVSYIRSPQFDLSGINYPKIEFSIWWDAEGFYDGANFQFKQGTGVWKTLGADEGNDSWYNSSYIYSIEKGFGFDLDNSAGWSGDGEWGYGSNGWVTVSHALTSINNLSDIAFRFAFASNSSYQNDGIAIDDINIFDDPTGIDNTKVLLSDIQIYPNPNEGTFRLVYNGERDVDLKLQLINIQGQVVLTEQIETGYRFSKEFELEYLPPGIYYFRLMHKEGVVVKKMVVR